jgi:hypothetical protein
MSSTDIDAIEFYMNLERRRYNECYYPLEAEMFRQVPWLERQWRMYSTRFCRETMMWLFIGVPQIFWCTYANGGTDWAASRWSLLAVSVLARGAVGWDGWHCWWHLEEKPPTKYDKDIEWSKQRAASRM